MSLMDLTLGAIFWGVLTFGAAWVGTLFMPDTWYSRLTKPSWNPPDAVFGPVWSVLYLLMAAAAWLVWRETDWGGFAGPLAFYVVQLVFNGAWNWLFFGRHRPAVALLDIGALWLAVAATLIAFWKVVPLAGMLLIPYLAWITFASVLNFKLWRLNPAPIRSSSRQR